MRALKQREIKIVRACVLPMLVLATMGVDKGCVTSPTTDTIVNAKTQTVKGTISEYDAAGNLVGFQNGKARLRVGSGAWTPWANTVNNTWTITPVSLSSGVNVLRGETQRTAGTTSVNGTIADFILEYKTDLIDQGTQKVYLDWSESGIDSKIKEMATATLDPDPTAAQLNTFVTNVKAGVKDFVERAYSGMDVTVVASAETATQTVKFHNDTGCNLYGSSPGDYLNKNKTQTSNVYIDAIRCTIVDDLLTETPAKATDTLAQRVTDVATFIGRTAAHEVGHSLGLTDEGHLHGCEGMHNCESYDSSNPANRFDSGHHIMDPGPKSETFARIGQANATARQWQRPVFEPYGKSYLQLIHPK